MPDSPTKKLSTLTIKPRASSAQDSDKPRKSQSLKTGARAHQRTRMETEQRRTEAPTNVASPQKPSTRTERQTPASADKRSSMRGDSRSEKRGEWQHDGRGHDRSSDRRHDRAPARREPNAREQINPGSRATEQATEHHPLSQTTAPDASETFRMFASCPRGLEQALSDELSKIGLTGVQPAQAGCRFHGNWFDMWRANLHSRLATRILVQLAHGRVAREDDLRALALSVNWERWLGPEKTLRVDTSAIRSPMQSLQFCNLLVKDSICDRLREKEGARPSIDTVRPDVRVHSFLAQDSATLYLDTSGESLFKRGWRLDKAQAPIRENLAAGLLAISGWQANQALLDPFCGSGTILIEAAWMALNIPPGINRPFAFERLRAHDPETWQAMRKEATESIQTELPAPIVGCDLSQEALDAAKLNAQRAGLQPNTIQWLKSDARALAPPAQTGMIVTNPPYGERLDIDAELMPAWATELKRHYAGWQVNVISADQTLPGALRLKPKRRVPLFNGALDCRLFMFEMVSADYDPKSKRDTAKKQHTDDS
jgi:putative N6-adenine-specific DNA methylase